MSDGNDPFACFGDSDSSGSDHRADDGPLDPSAASNHDSRPVAIAPVTNDAFEVFDAGPLSGKGLRTTVGYKRGDEILRESPVMRLPNSHAASSLAAARALHRQAVQRAFRSLHPETRAAVLDLSSRNEDDDARTPGGVYDTNAYRLGDSIDNGALFLTIARMNHSCRPNAYHFWRDDLKMFLVSAARDIEIGEELCTCYGPGASLSTEGRREYLAGRFSFKCRCEMCLEGNAYGGDDRMGEIRSLREDLALSSSVSTSYATAATKLESVERCLSLLAAQGIGGGAYVKSVHHHGYEICMAAGDVDGAGSYLGRELEAVRDSEGKDSPNAVAIEHALHVR